MERLGLGTPATRADIINTLLERGYVVRKGKSLVSTPKGKELISKLRDSRISSPEMTAEWEKELETIYTQRKGKSGYERFLEGIKEFVKNEIENLKGRVFTAPRQATKKMLDLAKSIAKETGLKVPKETDFETIKSFIDKALKEKERQLAEGIDKCKCGGKIIPFKKGWKCEACGAVVWNTMFGKKISKNLAVKLLKGERVYVKGLKSKNGKRYSAYMCIEEGRVKLEFGA
jgi:DNA topoisomerase-3